MGCSSTKPRSISFDDGYFSEFKGKVLVVGVVMRGSEIVENVVAGQVTVDGDDATKVIVDLVESIPQKLNVIFSDGVSLGGFNVVDLEQVHKKTGVPVISITRKKPDLESIKKAIENTPNSQKKWEILLSNGPLFKYEKIFFQFCGTSRKEAELLIKESSKSNIPEGLRLAHMIASGVSRSGSLA